MKTTLLFRIFLILFFGVIIISCKKNDSSGVPITAVDTYLYTNNPSFSNLYSIGGWTYITGGVRGILIYRKSQTEFMAYDRNCTYQPSNPCATVIVDVTNILATDTCCHSKFSIYDGSVTQGPASLPLKAYNTTFDGSVLHIYN